MIISVDYDGTLEINGRLNIPLIEKLKSDQRNGHFIILNTCREGASLIKALRLCKSCGIIFNSVNENLPMIVKQFGYNPRKIFADVYIDDKAIKP